MKKIFFVKILALMGFAIIGGVQAQPVPKVDISSAINEKVIQIPASVASAQIAYLLSYQSQAIPQWVIILLPGHNGLLHLQEDSAVQNTFELAGNFLVRSRALWLDASTATVVVDAPSDQQGEGNTDPFRMSARHANDVHEIITDVKRRFPDSKMVLIGTSRGTISSAFVGKALQSELFAVIHTSTMTGGVSGIHWGFDYSAIKSRQLFVHHADDACRVTRYSEIAEIAKKFKVPLVTVKGGTSEGNPCKGRAHHGFPGNEAVVIRMLKQWLDDALLPLSIE